MKQSRYQHNSFSFTNPFSSSTDFREQHTDHETFFSYEGSSLIKVHNYRKHCKKVDQKYKKSLLSFAVEVLLKEGKSLASKGGILTKRTTIASYKPGSEWDLDSSLDSMLAQGTYKLPSYQDLFSRKLIRSRRCFVILADKSNSLGAVIDYVALAVSVLAEAISNEDYAVLLFDAQVKKVKTVKSNRDTATVLEEILNVECHGATDLQLAFEKAKEQLNISANGTEGVCVLISDCIPTCGLDPIETASSLPKMEVLLLRNETIVIGNSCIGKLEKLPNVKVREIKDFGNIIDAIQEIVSYLNI